MQIFNLKAFVTQYHIPTFNHVIPHFFFVSENNN